MHMLKNTRHRQPLWQSFIYGIVWPHNGVTTANTWGNQWPLHNNLTPAVTAGFHQSTRYKLENQFLTSHLNKMSISSHEWIYFVHLQLIKCDKIRSTCFCIHWLECCQLNTSRLCLSCIQLIPPEQNGRHSGRRPFQINFREWKW